MGVSSGASTPSDRGIPSGPVSIGTFFFDSAAFEIEADRSRSAVKIFIARLYSTFRSRPLRFKLANYNRSAYYPPFILQREGQNVGFFSENYGGKDLNHGELLEAADEALLVLKRVLAINRIDLMVSGSGPTTAELGPRLVVDNTRLQLQPLDRTGAGGLAHRVEQKKRLIKNW